MRELDRVLVHRAVMSAGQPVAHERRRAVESATGIDLTGVRVHREPAARAAARLLGASAFTIGTDVAVGGPPDAPVAQQLLDHELIHAAQALAGTASPRGDAVESQARGGLSGLTQPLAALPVGQPACSREDWLNSTPAIGTYTVPQLLDELREITEWLDRQVAGTPETDRMFEARNLINGELARRRGAIAAADRPQRGRRRGATPASQPGPDVAPPRVLTEQASRQLTDPAEVSDEVGRIMAWLQHTDLSRGDRAALHSELDALAPQLAANLNQASAQRQQARLSRALAPASQDRAGTIANLQLIDSIRPYAERPGMAYVMHEGEMLVFPLELANQVRAQVLDALSQAITRARITNESTRDRMNAHMRLNYEEQPVVGFAVSVWSGEEPVEVQTRMEEPLSASRIHIAAFNRGRDHDSLARLGGLVYDAAEEAATAQHIVYVGVERAISAAGHIVTALEITRDVAAAVALSIGAILAAPVVAAGVAGLGVTGAGATALTALGTGTIVGAEGYGYGLAGGAGGELAAGHGVSAALHAGNEQGLHYGAQGFAIGLGGGTTLGLARNLGVGGAGLSWGSNLGRTVLAQGTGNAVGSMTGALLSPPEGTDRGTAVWHAGVLGFGLGSFGAVAGVGARGLSSPVARAGVGIGLPALADAGVSYAQTRDWRQAALSGGLSLGVGAIAHNAPRSGPAEDRAFEWGRSTRRGIGSVTRTGRAALAATALGLGAVPALRMQNASAAPSLIEADPVVSGRRLGVTSEPSSAEPLTNAPPAAPAAETPTQQAPAPAAPTEAQPAAQPDRGLADQGVRPAPGTRTETRAEYRARSGRERWAAAVDQFLDENFADRVEVPRVTGGQSNPRIGGRAVPGRPPQRIDIENIPRLPGETQRQALARVRGVVSQPISAFPRLEALWNAARASVLSRNTLTSSNYGELYDATRRGF
jgi:hypothetical protein